MILLRIRTGTVPYRCRGGSVYFPEENLSTKFYKKKGNKKTK